MKIISRFKDYYDYAVGHDPVEEPLYKRTLEHFQIKKGISSSLKFPKMGILYGIHCERGYLFYCGDILPFVRIPIKDNPVFYDISSLEEYFKEIFNEKTFLKWYRGDWQIDLSDREYFENHFNFEDRWGDNSLGLIKSVFKEILETEIPKCPLMVLSSKEVNVIGNICLQDFSFQKVKTAFEAYKDIERFLQGPANPSPPVIEVADKYQIISKGYDQKSFRKDPTKPWKPRK
jgi:hypothetical protein